MLQHGQFLGSEAWTLENDALRAVILPGHGGKVASLVWRASLFELLFQNPHPTFAAAHCGDDFSRFEACGFDEAFPTVDPCTVTVDGQPVPYPDHGELWSAAFAAHPDGEALVLTFTSPLLGYRYTKRFSLEGSRLVCRYHIENPTPRDFPALWVCHCLVRAEPDLRIELPPEVTAVENVFANPLLGEAAQRRPYPVADGPHGPVDLRQMPPDGMVKFYADGPVQAGWCRYHYPHAGVTATLRYDPKALPYLGFWATAGGYRGDVNCALEPANGYYDNIPLAQSRGACPVLKAGASWDFPLEIELTGC